MRGKKSYNIRNIEAHISNFSNANASNTYLQPQSQIITPSSMVFQNNAGINQSEINKQISVNEYLNAKFGVSRYASNLVSGKMFRKI